MAVDTAGMQVEATTDTSPVADLEADAPAATMDEDADPLETARADDKNTSKLPPSAPIPAKPRRAAHFPLTPAAKAVLDVVAHALQAGESVSLPGLGALTVRTQPARTGRHPRSGEVILIPAKSRVHFKQASSLRQRLNPEA